MAIPNEFSTMMLQQLPKAQVDELLAAIATEPTVSIRCNPAAKDAMDMALASLGVKSDGTVPWASHACWLESRPQFTMDPLFHTGAYYVQEASSMFLEQAVRKIGESPMHVLDLCAAPGGKSTHLASLLPEGSLLVSNEIQRGRAQILAENMVKWGRANCIVTCNTPRQIGDSGLKFDLIAVDAPCSGEGMFRKDGQAVADWSPDNVKMCALRQRRILEDIWPALNQGGYLIYSTCTFNRYEDEDNVKWIIQELGAEPVGMEVPEEWNITGSLTDDSLPVYHFMQHRTRGEGFFLALLRKTSGNSRNMEKAFRPSGQPVPAHCREWLEGEFEFAAVKDSITAYPKELAGIMQQVSLLLYPLVCGVEVAAMKGRDYVPAHSLAMSCALCGESFPRAELTRQQALEYLHCEAIQLTDVPKGIVLLTYMGRPLGFAKNLGNRANNMYPQQWRIRRDVHSVDAQ